MDEMTRWRSISLVVILGILAISACRRTPEEAIIELQRCGARFEEEDFFKAIAEGNTREVGLFLDGGMDANRPAARQGGDSPLTVAALNNHFAIAKLLLKRGAAVDGPGSGKSSPLEKLACTDKSKMAKFLLSRGADPNRRTSSRGETALHNAASNGSTDMIRVLMRAGADPGICNNRGRTPVMNAISAGKLDVFTELLRHSKRKDLETVCGGKAPALFRAIDSEEPEMALALLDAGVNAGVGDAKGVLPLTAALSRKLDDVAIAIVKHGSVEDPGAMQRALGEACRYGRPKVGQHMIEAGASVDDLEATDLLFWAALTGQPALAETARERGAKIFSKDNHKHTILERAAEAGHMNMVTWALEFPYFARDPHLRTPPIYLAALNGHLEIIRKLLETGADPNRQNYARDSAIFAAAERGDLAAAHLLLLHGANPRVGNNGFETPLGLAAAAGATALVGEFIDAGVNPDDGLRRAPPILTAVEQGNVDMAKMLFEAGADPWLPGEDGMTASLLAAQKGDERLSFLVRPPVPLDDAPSPLQARKARDRKDQYSRARKKGTDLLFQAVYADQGAIITRLLAAGISPNAWRYGRDSAVWVAVNLRKPAALKALLESGEEITSWGRRPGPGYSEKVEDRTLLMQAVALVEPDQFAWSKEEYRKRALENSKMRAPQNPDPKQLKIVEILTDNDADINARNREHLTALILASAFAGSDTVDLLLKRGADPNARSRYGETALQAAAKRGDPRIVRALLRAGADPTEEDIQDRSPLLMAQGAGNKEVIAILCAQPTVNCPEYESEPKPTEVAGSSTETTKLPLKRQQSEPPRPENNDRFLIRSINENSLENVEKALAGGASPDSKDRNGLPALLVAAGKRQHKIMRLLLDAGADVNRYINSDYGSTALVRAISSNDPGGISLLLRAGADVNIRYDHGQSALHYAIGTNPEIVKLLVKARADVNWRNDKGFTPISSAATNFQTLEILLRDRPWFSPKADVNVPVETCKGCTVLLAALRNVDAVKLLLDFGADVEARDPEGMTALMLAAKRGYCGVVAALLEAGATIDARSNDGRTALAHAADGDSAELLQLLLRHGADVNVRDQHGMKPLMIAIERDSRYPNQSIISFLLEAGADAEERDSSGRTLLMWASGSCQYQVVQALLKRFIPVTPTDNEGRTALHHILLTIKRNNPCTESWSIIEALVNAGADVEAADKNGVKPVDLVEIHPGLQEYFDNVIRQKACVSKKRILK